VHPAGLKRHFVFVVCLLLVLFLRELPQRSAADAADADADATDALLGCAGF
jgi:hypothetical protein